MSQDEYEGATERLAPWQRFSLAPLIAAPVAGLTWAGTKRMAAFAREYASSSFQSGIADGLWVVADVLGVGVFFVVFMLIWMDRPRRPGGDANGV